MQEFDALCASLLRDYADGTLSNYYQDLQPSLAQPQKLRRSGLDSTKPGRDLLNGLRGYDLSLPALQHCAQLQTELADLE